MSSVVVAIGLAVLAAVLLGVELFTTNLVFASLAAGCAAAAVTLGMNLPAPVVAITTLAVTGVSLLLVRPAALKRLDSAPSTRSGVEALPGKTGRVLEGGERAIVSVEGQQWSATSIEGVPLEPGAHVWVVEVDGATLVVAPENS